MSDEERKNNQYFIVISNNLYRDEYHMFTLNFV